MVNFELSSNLAEMYWINPAGEEKKIVSASTASRIVEFVQDGKLKIQNFRVITASGIISNYYVAPVMIPKMTKFTINGVSGTITRDIAYYNRYNIVLRLTDSSDLSNVVSRFLKRMNNDSEFVGQEQTVV